MKAEAIVSDFISNGWKSEPMNRLLELAMESPPGVTHLLRIALAEGLPSTTFVDAAISFIPENDFPSLVSTAIDALKDRSAIAVAESLIAYTSLQSVTSLHPHLATLFELRPNSGTYYENWPWRGADLGQAEFLVKIIEDAERSEEDRYTAWRCLLETRQADLLMFAVSEIDRIQPPQTVDWALHLVGLELDGNVPRQLYSDAVYHLIFDTHYHLRALSNSRRKAFLTTHPTWQTTESQLITAKFGGLSDNLCLSCGTPESHLITLDPVPNHLVISDLDKVQLTTCIPCLFLGSGELRFHHHPKHGRSVPLYNPRKTESSLNSLVELRPFRVGLAQTPARWQWQDNALSNWGENLNRVGGSPSWIQNPEYPECPNCGQTMSFLMQLDSDLPTANGGILDWGDSGMLYVMWCDRCKISTQFEQSY